MSLLFRASARYLARHRLQCALAISGIALGVAIVIGIQAVQLSARNAFAQSLLSIFGHATHDISAVDGLLDESVLASVRRRLPQWRPTPILEARVTASGAARPTALRLLGIDALTSTGAGVSADFDVQRFMRERGAAVINRATAARLGLHRGAELSVQYPAAGGTLVIMDIVDHAGAGAGAVALADNLVLVDLATAQEILDLHGRLSRIELYADRAAADAAGLEIAERALTTALPAGVVLNERGSERHGADQLTRAFYTNLDALSLLALLVGAFMIYNTVSFLVVQRHTLFARLRALGVTRSAIAWQVAGEALLLGLLGGILGNLLGFGLAGMLMTPLSQTLSDHYFQAALTETGFTPALFGAGMLLALITATGAAVLPARHASRIAPAQTLRPSAQEADARRLLLRLAQAGALLALVCLLLLLSSSRSLYAGFAALGCLLLAATLAAPRLVQDLLKLIDRYAGPRLPLAERLAVKGAGRSMGRIGLAIAALMAATATSIGVALMVGSFRLAVSDWLEHLLRADLYLTQQQQAHTPPRLDDDSVAALLDDPRIVAVSRVRRTSGTLAQGQSIQINAYALPAPARAGFRFIAGDPATAWQQWDAPDSVFVTEPFAWHHRLALGDTLTVITPRGSRDMVVRGIYADYGSERGVVALSWLNYRRLWRDERADSLGIYTRAGTDVDALEQELATRAAATGDLVVWSNAGLKRQSLAVFDRTFAITDVLTLFAALIAALGVFNALLALNLERAREYAIMRATGFSRAAVRRCLYAQTLIVSVLAIVLAVPLGFAIALVLIEIINVRSFGWSMPFAWHSAAWLLPGALALGAACLATVYPAERALATAPAAALRYE